MDDGPVEITDELERAAVQAQALRVRRKGLIFAAVVTVLAVFL